MALTYQQMKLVKSTVPVLKESGELIATTFYRDMLAENPRLREVFNGVNLKSGRQPRALTQVMLSFANNVSHMSELIPTLEKVGEKKIKSAGEETNGWTASCARQRENTTDWTRTPGMQ